jgi:hypothetical protein
MLAKYSLHFNNRVTTSKKFSTKAQDVEFLSSMATETASFKLTNYMVPAISCSGIANSIMRFKNRQSPLPHAVSITND